MNEKMNGDNGGLDKSVCMCGGGSGAQFIAGKFSCQASHEMEHGSDLRDHLVQPPRFPEAKASWRSAPMKYKWMLHETQKKILGKAIILSNK